jgi:hypothetical protein
MGVLYFTIGVVLVVLIYAVLEFLCQVFADCSAVSGEA